MTTDDLKAYLFCNFPKWKVVEDCENYTITVRVKGPIDLFYMCRMGNIAPAGVVIKFYTMGFFESLFSPKTKWIIK